MTDLAEIVFDALTNAQDNGAFAPDGELYLASHQRVAEDMMDCDAEIAAWPDISVDKLVPHIVAWRAGACL